MNQENTITVCGRLDGELSHAYTAFDEPFYTGYLLVGRLSGTIDRLPITVPGKLMADTVATKQPVMVRGQVRSYTKVDDNGNSRLEVTIFVNEIIPGRGFIDSTTNEVTIIGTICRKPTYRTTPFGREICDVMIAVNRGFGKSDYIPCIAWGRNAQYISRFKEGDRFELNGRLQSRNYDKLQDDGTFITRTVYEVSAFTVAPAASAVREARYA